MDDCQCSACAGLRAECGSHYGWLSKKLLQRGWAGQTSPAEKAYLRAHSPRSIAAAERYRANPNSPLRRPRQPAGASTPDQIVGKHRYPRYQPMADAIPVGGTAVQ
jgi:hypothetical protein